MNIVRFRVRFYETDMMGIVHHSNHIRWFEMGRVEYFRQAKMDYNILMHEEGYVLPIKDVKVDYKEVARYDDILILETRLVQATRVRIVFSYRITRESDGALIATGTTTNAVTDREGRVKRLPEHYQKAFLACIEEDGKCMNPEQEEMIAR